MRRQRSHACRVTLWLCVVGMFGCALTAYGSNRDTTNEAITPHAVIATYARIVYASYEDTYSTALALQSALHTFVARPSPAALEAAKTAWKRARIPYGQTEAYRFYAGPIDATNGPEGYINAWPLDESYIDYVVGNPTAGIIHQAEMVITPERLRVMNEDGGEENVSTGFHAIEFLLWGQDLSPDGPGARAYTDYVVLANSPASPQARRGQYLLSVADMLVRDLKHLLEAWAPHTPDNYRAAFLQEEPTEALRKILVGIGTLGRGELAGERLAVALATRDQEDEHSCFSDNTHIDIIQNARAIQNVFEGEYVRTNGIVIEGPGIADLISEDLKASMERQLAMTMIKVHAIEPPFDREILTVEGRQRVQHAIDALRAQARLIVAIAKELGIPHLQVEIPA
ncbi:MAG: imelysin family protein [Candidatus Tectomicrobia bacterium]